MATGIPKAIAQKFRQLSGMRGEDENTKPNDSDSGKASGSTRSTKRKEAAKTTSTQDKHKKKKQKGQKINPDSWKCQLCKVTFCNDDDKILECDACCAHFCADCLEMTVNLQTVSCC